MHTRTRTYSTIFERVLNVQVQRLLHVSYFFYVLLHHKFLYRIWYQGGWEEISDAKNPGRNKVGLPKKLRFSVILRTFLAISGDFMY